MTKLAEWQERLESLHRRRRIAAHLARNPRPSFSDDFVSARGPVWSQLFEKWRGQPDASFLLLGGYEGRAPIWLLKNVLSHPTARLTCVTVFADPVIGLRFDHNLTVSGQSSRTVILRERVSLVLPTLGSACFDAVLLDGSYLAPTLQDAVEALRVLKPGGILLIDGRFWEVTTAPGLPPIDAFLEMVDGQADVVFRRYEIAFRKG